MYLVALVWSIYRYIFGRHFSLPVGVAMVWISNPLTTVPLYYLFLVTGYRLLETQNGISYELFTEYLGHISSTEGTWEMIVAGANFLLVDLGWPMIIGSLVYAVPVFIIRYFITERIVTSYRKGKASLAGISYKDWRTQKETQH